MLNKIKSGIKALTAIIKNTIFLRFKKNIKLNLGAGGTRLEDYLNVDSIFMKNTDLLCNLKRLPFFVKKATVSKIYASHILEHFSESEVKKMLKIFYDLLQKGGELRISVPDIDKIVKIYQNNWEHFQTKGHAPWNGLIYGGQTTKFDFHKSGFNYNWLSYLLEKTNFSEIKEYDAVEFTKSKNIHDGSLANRPFGEYISLNIKAIK